MNEAVDVQTLQHLHTLSEYTAIEHGEVPHGGQSAAFYDFPNMQHYGERAGLARLDIHQKYWYF